jgi:hypothetical protein
VLVKTEKGFVKNGQNVECVPQDKEMPDEGLVLECLIFTTEMQF